MTKHWSLGGLSPVQVVKRTCQRSWEDEAFGQSARLAFYFFFAMFPLLLLLLMVLGASANSGAGWRGALLDPLNQMLPLDVAQLLNKTLNELTRSAFGGRGALVAALSAVWGILNGTRSILSGLNDAYEVEENRPWWHLALITLALTLGLCGLAFSALAAIRPLATHGGSAATPGITRHLLEWAIVILLHALCFALLYRFGPSLKHPEWKWSVPGALLAAILWAVFTAGLRLYHQHASTTQRIYGSLNPVATLLLWLYLIGGAIFLGAETNAVIAKAARQDR
jgi:membrane protein